MEKMMKKIWLMMGCVMTSQVSMAGDPVPLPCEETVLAPTGLTRDGANTRDWLSSVERYLDGTMNAKNARTFGCDEVKMVIGDFPPKDGDYAFFTNYFDSNSSMGEPEFRSQVKFEFTLKISDLLNSFQHNDSFTLFRVLDEASDETSVMMQVKMIRHKVFTKPVGDGMSTQQDYWLAEMSWNNLVNGTTFIQTHRVHGEYLRFKYQWNKGGRFFMNDESMILEDKNGQVHYKNLTANFFDIVPALNYLGLVDSSKVLRMDDEIVIKGPTPYPYR